MPEFVVDPIKSVLDSIHELYTTATGVKIARGGQDTVRAPRPFAVYDDITEAKYKRHSIMRKYSEDLYGNEIINYKQPHKYKFQYSYIFDANDSNCATVITSISRLLVSDKFQAAMNKLVVGFFVSTDIREENLAIEFFSDRQFMFEIDYFWADTWTDIGEPGLDKINTVEFAETTPPEGS